MLRPGIIIVGVVQGDDLEQSGANDSAKPIHPAIEPKGQTDALGHLFPTFARWRIPETGDQPTIISAEELRDTWITVAKTCVASSKPEIKKRYDALDENIKAPFLAGRLNPWMLRLALNDPEFLMRPLDSSSADTRARIGSIVRQFARIKAVAGRDDARVIVVSIPSAPYVDETSMESVARLGFTIAPGVMTSSTAPDDEIAEAASTAGFEFVSVLEAFPRSTVKSGHE